MDDSGTPPGDRPPDDPDTELTYDAGTAGCCVEGCAASFLVGAGALLWLVAWPFLRWRLTSEPVTYGDGIPEDGHRVLAQTFLVLLVTFVLAGVDVVASALRPRLFWAALVPFGLLVVLLLTMMGTIGV
jgi:hypothetical protein